MNHIIPISGKDSLATAIIQKQLDPTIDYIYIYNPTGFELPETIDWLKKVEIYLEKPIQFVGKNIVDTKEWQSGFRPSAFRRYCTFESKIKPMEDFTQGHGFIYYGLRADEPERIGYINKGKSELVPIYPLRSVGAGLSEVLKICQETGLKPPTFRWDYLEQEFTRRLGKDYLESILSEWQLDLLFAWRVRNNCFNCFFMGRYEWVGLSKFHPSLFWDMVKIEETLDSRKKQHNFIAKELSLRQLFEKKEEILENHINRICKEFRKQMQLSFDFPNFERIFHDSLATKSCGLYCGK